MTRRDLKEKKKEKWTKITFDAANKQGKKFFWG